MGIIPVRTASHEIDRSLLQTQHRSGYPVIATQHLRLRPFRLTDISSLVVAANGHHVADTVLDFPYPFTAKYAHQWIRSHPAAWDARDAVHWAISVLTDDRLVGYTCLDNLDLEECQAELTFWMGPGAERARYAAEATQAALAFAFTTLQINQVCAFHLTRNHLAMRVLARIGMQQEGPLDQRLCTSDQLDNVIVRAITRADWLASLSVGA
jgi:[ribosomal protein S5]-alanine N-acetyltransferase